MSKTVRVEERPLLLKVEEVAALLNISRSLTYELMQRGEIPTVRIAGARRVSRKALEAWIDSKTTYK